VDTLLDEDRRALLGPILTEVLCGFRRDAEADWASSLLRGLQYLEILWKDWREAASLHRQLAARNHVLPMSDLVIATVARRNNCSVYSTDLHFDLIPDLRRFWPEE
jgi:predicted nucleic acid-binding protein